MSKQVLLPHNHSGPIGHGPIVPPPGLEAAREKLKAEPLRCGSCKQNFSAICALHLHLKGDSYHYDKETLTAFPLDENSCPLVHDHESVEKAADAYFTQSGARIKNLSKHKSKSKKIKTEPVSTKPDKIINIQVYPQDDDDHVDEEADPINVDIEYSNPPTPVVDHGQDSLPVVGDGGEEAPVVTDNMENQVIAEEENFAEVEDFPGEVKNEIPPEEPIENVPLAETVQETVHQADDSICVPDQQNMSGLPAEGIETQTPLVVNKQMIIDLHSMETNEDGSLKIVVGEQDAAIFKTPQGEEILKALKAQGKGLSAKNTQIIYNYSVPVSVEGGDVLAGNEMGLTRSVKRELDPDGDGSAKKQRFIKKSKRQDDDGEELAEGIDGVDAVVFMRNAEKITTAEAMNILNECNLGMHEDKISKIQPLRAKGGDLYVVDLEALPNRKDIRHDKYMWYNCGYKRYPKNNELIKKIVFKIRLPDQTFSDGFMKSIFEWIDEKQRYCIIHYTGYESLFKPFPHGNCKTGKNFVRTCPSVIEELKEMANQQSDLSPQDVHKQIKVLAPSGLRNLRTPRNLDQIKNHFFYEKKRKMQLAKKKEADKKEAESQPGTQEEQQT